MRPFVLLRFGSIDVRGARVSTSTPKRKKRGRREDPRIAHTRELVYDATVEVVAEAGSAGVSVERIAERSGVARSTIYRRWPDQNRLYWEAFARLARAESLPSTGDTATDLAHYLDDYADRLNDPTYFAVLVALMDRAALDEDFAKLHKDTVNQRRSRGAAIFRAGVRSGSIRKDTDTRFAALSLVAPFAYIRMFRHERITARDKRMVLDDLLQRFATPEYLASLAERQ